MRARDGHHRADNRTGPWAGWRRRVTPHLTKLFACWRSLDELLAFEPPRDAPLAHKAARLRAKVARDEARALICDTDGRAWE